MGSSQQLLPLLRSTRSSTIRVTGRDARSRHARAIGPVRWGAAVVEPGRDVATHCWQEARVRRSGARRTTVWVAAAASPTARPARELRGMDDVPPAGQPAYSQRRIRHALELGAACVMIVAFLAMAMFV